MAALADLRWFAAASLLLPLMSCTMVRPEKNHQAPPELAPGETLWCLLPDGQLATELYETSLADQRAGISPSCKAPARFVRVPICKVGQQSHEETRELQSARQRASLDGSLQGDAHLGIAFCAPLPPR